MRLTAYRKKRDFSKTTEPKGKVAHHGPRLFIIQKHAASHLHYDLRLELHGVLKSWAVPKGPCLDPHVKRLAMQVEDHPIEYGNFEGLIPKGEYGGGTVMLWDKGSWEPLDQDPNLAYEKGHLHFLLHAEKLHGAWDLVRFKDKKHWLLIKHSDEYARDINDYDITEDLDKSVKTQRSLEEITHNVRPQKGIQLPKGLKKSPMPDLILPQLATLVDKPPDTQKWLHEIKLDGYRIIAFKKGKKVELKSRNNKDWTAPFRDIADAIQVLDFQNLILDGEVVMLDDQGKSNFQLLQNAIKQDKPRAFVYFIFDLLYLNDYDLRKLPLLERKSLLEKVLPLQSNILHFNDHMIGNGQELFNHACKLNLEGIVSKRTDCPYRSKRTPEWYKIKCSKRQEFVIGGYTSPQRSRSHFGSLFLGVFNQKGQLEYTGNVGTGFNEASLKEIYELLVKNKATKNPFTTKPPGYSSAHWVKPQLIAEVEFTEWTQDGNLRHPSFKGLRFDKKAKEVMREVIQSPKKSNSILTNSSKILYPEDKITKEDLLHYYETVSEYILPYLDQRPLTLLRCPSGYHKCFYQRHYNKSTPKALHSIPIQTEETKNYIYLDDKEGLLSLVQMGVLEIHPWGSRIDDVDHPDIMVIDLDPGPNVPWAKVVASALEIREYLTQCQLKSFVKTTGGKGLHVVVPILPEFNWDELKIFTHAFVKSMEELKPDEYISKMTKSKRTNKIYIDYLRNQKTATAIGPYSTRARLHAPVATPLFWEELSDRIEENTYTIKTLPKRLAALKKDPWEDFWKIKQSLRRFSE